MPDPANCSRYYIVSTVINNGFSEKIPYLFLLDMSLLNDLYLNSPCELFGALVPLQYTTGNPAQPLNYIGIDAISQNNFVMPSLSPGKRSGSFMAASKKHADGSYKVFISNGGGIYTFTVNQLGFNFTHFFNFPTAGFNPNPPPPITP